MYVSEGADVIIRREYEFHGIDRCVCAGATVANISFNETCDSDNCLIVTTDKGVYKSKQVISTTSVGVLARKGVRMGIFEGKDDDDAKYNAMKHIYFNPDPDLTSRGQDGAEHMPLYYTIAFQFDESRAVWDNDHAL
mmetsp:Transcript_11299/g.20733  ORF Transcript_11299/g.20733 Transcript_11299/m.20733 type:complete len:137 (-) Transcript_11299:1394-1804(-)